MHNEASMLVAVQPTTSGQLPKTTRIYAYCVKWLLKKSPQTSTLSGTQELSKLNIS
jgi:hypothetical protein